MKKLSTSKFNPMSKITVKYPIVNIDLAHNKCKNQIIIKNNLIKQFLKIKLNYYDI